MAALTFRRLCLVAVLVAAGSFALGHALLGGDKSDQSGDVGTLSLGVGCGFCAAVLSKVFRRYRQTGQPRTVTDTLLPLCVQLQLAPEDVCIAVIDTFLPSVIYIADRENSTYFADTFCRLLINKEACVFQDEWTVDVDTEKPEVVTPTVANTSGNSVKILHLTDVHYDPAYTLTNSCRTVAGAPPAGYWGSYTGCDVPMHTFRNMLEHIWRQHPKIDYVYFTGDIVNHMIWETSEESNEKAITAVVKTLAEFFDNITVLHTIGNHEPSPINLFAPIEVEDTNVSTTWLYQLAAELWSPYITEDAKQTILRGGFYTLKLREGFRVIVLNNGVCYNYNFWLVYESQDPYGQLKWLAETLLQAEKDQEKVHILYHIPTGSKDCVRTWSREYHKIVDRFESIITAQFNGHTHFDEFHIFYSVGNTSRANSVVLNGGSVTSYENVNMNYKVYTVDPSSWYLIDGESWVFNLSDANLHPNENPKWYRLYSYSEAYNVSSLVPSELDSLVKRMTVDHSLLQKYNRYYVKDASPSMKHGCDIDCLKSRLCDIVMTESGDMTQCYQLQEKFDASLLPRVTTPCPVTTPTTSGHNGSNTRHSIYTILTLALTAMGHLLQTLIALTRV